MFISVGRFILEHTLTLGMNNMDTLTRIICESLEQGEDVVMVTIVDSSGKTRLAGARMLLQRNGSTHGSIGGGFFEAEVQAAMAGLFAGDKPEIRTIRHSGENATSLQAPCGSCTTAVIEHLAANRHNRKIFRQLLEALQKNHTCCLVTDLTGEKGKEPGFTKKLSHYNESVPAADETERSFPYPELKEKLASVTVPVIESFGNRQFFLNPWRAPETVYLCGAGHVAQEVAELAGKSGFRVIVMDDREKYANRDRFPSVQSVVALESFDDCFNGMVVNDDSYVIIATRGHRCENTLVKQALKTRAGYIGLIGSLRKRNALFAELAVEGFSNDDLLRVYCPTGMSILAETPQEIAVSIVAQLVFIRARKSHARKKSATLHVETSFQHMCQPQAAGEGIRVIR